MDKVAEFPDRQRRELFGETAAAMKTTNEEAKQYIAGHLLPEISTLLAPLCRCRVNRDNPFAIVVSYPALYGAGYLRAEILLEIGPLASWSPSGAFAVQPYAAQYFPDVFERASCEVTTILATRTFWEKATILHREAHRSIDKPMPPRYSRHYYDLALLAQSRIKNEALGDLELLADVVAFKERFYPTGWARYDLANVGSFALVPPEARLREIDDDYKKMQAMIFDKKLELSDILRALTSLEGEINALGTNSSGKSGR